MTPPPRPVTIADKEDDDEHDNAADAFLAAVMPWEKNSVDADGVESNVQGRTVPRRTSLAIETRLVIVCCLVLM